MSENILPNKIPSELPKNTKINKAETNKKNDAASFLNFIAQYIIRLKSIGIVN